MLIGIPLFNGRVAPRCKIADSILIIRVSGNSIVSTKHVSPDNSNWDGLLKSFLDKRIDTIVCGGINKEDKKLATSQGLTVIDNVACSEEELFEAVEKDQLRPGYGFISGPIDNEIPEVKPGEKKLPKNFNCLKCMNRICESGGICPFLDGSETIEWDEKYEKMLDFAHDISLEDERKLCRLSELIYYAIEMKYRKIGIAYCTDLEEATEILVSVLRRFFDVNPVCCKISATEISPHNKKYNSRAVCNPIAQAKILNELKTDFNVIVGLCIGADCIFSEFSDAPATTLFIKDKSLANNPIGALYSEYYLNEFENSELD